MSTLGPIVVMQRDAQHWPTEQHVFPDSDAFVAWLDSQETTVFLEIEPREEVITPESSTLWDRVHNRPADIYTPPEDLVELSPQQPYEPNPQDFCPSCGLRITDFQEGGYEDESGQRGHLKCRNIAIQRRNAAINRENAERLRDAGENALAEQWYRLADETDAWADRQETD